MTSNSEVRKVLYDILTRPTAIVLRYLAVGHRIECKDHIGVYAVNPWQELSKFRSRTSDMVSLYWTPGGTHIVAQDSHLNYRVVIYTPAGEVQSNHSFDC